jgi:hypothetical protein
MSLKAPGFINPWNLCSDFLVSEFAFSNGFSTCAATTGCAARTTPAPSSRAATTTTRYPRSRATSPSSPWARRKERKERLFPFSFFLFPFSFFLFPFSATSRTEPLQHRSEHICHRRPPLLLGRRLHPALLPLSTATCYIRTHRARAVRTITVNYYHYLFTTRTIIERKAELLGQHARTLYSRSKKLPNLLGPPTT